jgi:hypothetical protein
MLVKRGHGIRIIEDVVESASLRTLVAIYGSRVQLNRCRTSFDLMFAYQRHLLEEFMIIYIISNIDTVKKGAFRRISLYKHNIVNNVFMLPSEILAELDILRQFKSMSRNRSICCFTLNKID